jgi:hypothetical protein
MPDTARDRAKEVLLAHCSSNNRSKRAAAIVILGDVDLFELFVKAVQATQNKTKKIIDT